MLLINILPFLSAVFLSSSQMARRYEPTWESLNKRPVPTWLDEANIGVYIHWGVYSVPSFGSENFLRELNQNNSKYIEFMKKNYPPGFTYEDFAPQLTAEFFNATQWAKQIQKFGAKFVIIVAKHEDGYVMWPSKYSINWNSMDVGPHKDILGDFAEALRKNTDLKLGFEYYLTESFNTLYKADEASGFTTSNYVDSKILPELTELVKNYKPDILIPFYPHEGTSNYWKSKQFLAWLYNESPVTETVVVNDLWGSDTSQKHGSIYYGKHASQKWYQALALDKESHAYRRNANIEDFRTMSEIIGKIAQDVSGNGMAIFGIGITKEGTISTIHQEILNEMGEWLSVNGEAIYGAKPWTQQIDVNKYTYYTTKEKAVYAISTRWPENNKLSLKYVTELFFKSSTRAILLGGNGEYLEWEIRNEMVTLFFPDKTTVQTNCGYVVKIQT